MAAVGLFQRFVALEAGLEGHRVRLFRTLDEVHHGVVDAALDRQGEVVRLETGGNQMERFVVDQEGA